MPTRASAAMPSTPAVCVILPALNEEASLADVLRRIPGTIDGLGPVGGGMHTREEYVDLESLERRIGLISEALVFARDNR